MKRTLSLLLAVIFCLALLPAAALADAEIVEEAALDGDTIVIGEDAQEPGGIEPVEPEPVEPEPKDVEIVIGGDPASPVPQEGEIILVRGPQDTVAGFLDEAEFSVIAVGNGLSYFWEVTGNGEDYHLLPGANNRVLRIPYSIFGMEFFAVRCIIIDEDGNFVITDPATVDVRWSYEPQRPEVIVVDPGTDPIPVGDIMQAADTRMNEERAELFYEAVGSTLGARCTPVGYLASQVVNGTCHWFVATRSLVIPGARTEFVVLQIWEKTDGTCSVVNSERISYAQAAGLLGFDPLDPESAEPEILFDDEGLGGTVLNADGLYVRVAQVISFGDSTGLFIAQVKPDANGHFELPLLGIMGMELKSVNVALVPTLADINTPTPNVVAYAMANVSSGPLGYWIVKH